MTMTAKQETGRDFGSILLSLRNDSKLTRELLAAKANLPLETIVQLEAGKLSPTMEILHRLNREHGKTIVMVTHDQRLADNTARIVRMFDGRQVA